MTIETKFQPCQIYALYCFGSLALAAALAITLATVCSVIDWFKDHKKGGAE